MDWREMAGRPTVRMADFWTNYRWAWSGGKKVGYGYDQIQSWNGQIDPVRGWVIAVCWIAACSAEYVHSTMSFVSDLTFVPASTTFTSSFGAHVSSSTSHSPSSSTT